MLTCFLPPKTFLSDSSALIMRRFLLSWSLCFLMYSQSFLVTCVRGIAFDPMTSASMSLGVIGFMKAALGFRPFLAAICSSSESVGFGPGKPRELYHGYGPPVPSTSRGADGGWPRRFSGG